MKKKIAKRVAAVMAIAFLCAPVSLSLAFNPGQCQKSNCGASAGTVTTAGVCNHGYTFYVYRCTNNHTYAACSTSYH